MNRVHPAPRSFGKAALITALAIGAAVLTTTPAQADRIRLLGSSSVGSGGPVGTSGFKNPLRLSSGEGDEGSASILPKHRRHSDDKKGPQIPNPSSTKVTRADSSYDGFAGLNIIDQLLADGGNQFWIEPPDQALAVGNGYVLEAVNTTMVIYDKSGKIVGGPTALNPFFTGDHQVTSDTYGAFLSDPSAYYDPAAGRWFMSILEADVDPLTGALDPSHTAVLIAVSKTSNPTGAWWIYEVDTTDIGLPDYPMIGTDANGLYISVNSFTFPDFEFKGAYVYAVQKSALINPGTPPNIVLPNIVQIGSLLGDSGVGLQPATIPPGGAFCASGGGTEYFMSTLDLDSTLDNQILVWALSNTSSLNNPVPNLTLARRVVNTQDYGFPLPADQRRGPTPLGDALGEPLEKISSNDDSMHQVVYADGKLWGAAHTIMKSSMHKNRTGIAYFIVEPSLKGGKLKAEIVNQGYVSVEDNSCLMPSMGVNKKGEGVMTFTVVGRDFHPTIAYARIDAKHGADKVQVVASGGVPLDGFSGYEAFGGAGVARWGDYSACAVDDATGEVWFAGEITTPVDPIYVWYANWQTHIGHVKP